MAPSFSRCTSMTCQQISQWVKHSCIWFGLKQYLFTIKHKTSFSENGECATCILGCRKQKRVENKRTNKSKDKFRYVQVHTEQTYRKLYVPILCYFECSTIYNNVTRSVCASVFGHVGIGYTSNILTD